MIFKPVHKVHDVIIDQRPGNENGHGNIVSGEGGSFTPHQNLCFVDRGGREIRTLETREGLPAFQASALGHYAIPPKYSILVRGGPSIPCGIPAFQASALGLYATSPYMLPNFCLFISLLQLFLQIKLCNYFTYYAIA